MSSDFVREAGLFHLQPAIEPSTRGSLVSKGFEPSRPPMRRGPTILRGVTLSEMLGERLEPPPAPPQRPPRPPSAHQLRAALDKAERHQRRRATFLDSIGFAAFQRWAPDTAVTVTWDRCLYADPAHGHILGLPDRQRCARLRDELWRACRRAGLPFACTWVRAIGGGHGPHIHLGLWSAGHPERWVPLLTRLTGIGPTSRRLKHGYVAEADRGRWVIQRNTDPFALRGALGWGAYQLKQEERHPLTLAMDGKSVDVSRDIHASAIAPYRQEFEVWKRTVGWDRLVQEAHQRVA